MDNDKLQNYFNTFKQCRYLKESLELLNNNKNSFNFAEFSFLKAKLNFYYEENKDPSPLQILNTSNVRDIKIKNSSINVKKAYKQLNEISNNYKLRPCTSNYTIILRKKYINRIKFNIFDRLTYLDSEQPRPKGRGFERSPFTRLSY